MIESNDAERQYPGATPYTDAGCNKMVYHVTCTSDSKDPLVSEFLFTSADFGFSRSADICNKASKIQTSLFAETTNI